ncbi:MAG: EthD domain-containing protein [Actinomycetota bacterium]
MEKIDYLLWRDVGGLRDELIENVAPAIVDAGATALSVYVGDTEADIPRPSLLLGRGAELGAVLSVWLDSIDDRHPIEAAIGPADGYLVTESVPQRRRRDWPDGQPSPGVSHFTWFLKPDRLSDEEFFHGWHEVHTPSTTRLHPTRVGYVRDSVARVLTPGSPRVDAIVFEMFPTIEDYTDPKRLYGSQEALDETMEHLPLYADFETINARPLHEIVVRSL